MTDSELENVIYGFEKLSTLNMTISGETNWTTTSLRADLARLKAEKNIGWFVVDYLDKIKDVNKDGEIERTKQISANLHDICMDLDLAGLIIHSMTKEGIRADKKDMSHLSGSSKLAYDADEIIYMIQSDDDENVVYLKWAKMRESETGARGMKLYRVPRFPRFAQTTNIGV
jgi:replicative DNA helicase